MVTLAADTRNKKGMPAEWPVLANPGTRATLPRLLITAAELKAWKATRRAQYDAWKAAQPKPPTFVPTEIVAQDGSYWQISAAGALVKI